MRKVLERSMPRFGWPRKKPAKISADEALIAEAEAIANAGVSPMAFAPAALVR